MTDCPSLTYPLARFETRMSLMSAMAWGWTNIESLDGSLRPAAKCLDWHGTGQQLDLSRADLPEATSAQVSAVVPQIYWLPSMEPLLECTLQAVAIPHTGTARLESVSSTDWEWLLEWHTLSGAKMC